MAAPSKSPLPKELEVRGVTQDLLRQVVLLGERQGRDTAVAVDPPNFGGVAAHAMRVRGLATIFAPFGWRRKDVLGQAWIVSEDERHAICTCSGDERTGRPGRPFPRAAHQRGKVSAKSVQSNAEQLELPGFDVQAMRSLQDRGTYVWVLLVHRQEFANPSRFDEVRYELSLPTSFEKDNFVDFLHREWLDTLVLDGVDDDGHESDDSDLDDIIITRK